VSSDPRKIAERILDGTDGWALDFAETKRLARAYLDQRDRLAEAYELAEEGWGYAPDFFREKWGADEALAKLRALVKGDGE